jgi:hypothetical protein
MWNFIELLLALATIFGLIAAYVGIRDLIDPYRNPPDK